MRLLKLFLLAALLVCAAGPAGAQGAAAGVVQAPATSDAAAYLFNTLFYLGAGFLVLGMVGGFSLLQAGLAAQRNAGAIALRGVAIFAVSAIATWLVGHNLLYEIRPGELLGTLFAPWAPADADIVAATRPEAALWLYRASVPAIGALIIAGALGERVRLRALLLFTAIFAGIFYPIEASWSWGGGIIDATLSFKDFAGASVIHAAGGWAALAGALILGARHGRATVRRGAPALASFGAVVIWLGWLGLNAGAEGAFDAASHAVSISKIIVNTTLAGAAGLITAIILTQIVYRRIDLAVALAGAIGGLVSISAEPIAPALWQALVIGAFGGVLVAVGASLLARLRIDDSAHAIPAHLLCGVWGTFIAPWSSSDVTLAGQLGGAAMIGGFVFVMSILFWVVLKYTIGIRTPVDREHEGLDFTELHFDNDEARGAGAKA